MKNCKSILFTSASICLALVFNLQAQDTTSIPTAKQRTVTINGNQYLLKSRLKSILIAQFYYNFNHTIGYPNMEATLQRIGNAEGWKVDTETNPNNITASKLANYQVLFTDYISSFASSNQFPVTGQTAVQNFVEQQGNGIFVMHSTGDSKVGGNWSWYYNTLMPCHYSGESGASDANNNNTGLVGLWGGVGNFPSAKGNPIMEGITWPGAKPDSVTIQHMELHTFDKAITDPTITPANWQGLLGLNPSTCGNPNNCGNGIYNYTQVAGPSGWPISWTFPDKKGNVGYFMEGHDLVTMQSMGQTIWDKFFKQFMYYIAGYDTTAVTSIGSQPNLDLDLSQSGVTFHPTDVGVLITRPGSYVVALYNMSGQTVKMVRGNNSPVDLDFASDLQSRPKGVYLMRVATKGYSASRRFLSN